MPPKEQEGTFYMIAPWGMPPALKLTLRNTRCPAKNIPACTENIKITTGRHGKKVFPAFSSLRRKKREEEGRVKKIYEPRQQHAAFSHKKANGCFPGKRRIPFKKTVSCCFLGGRMMSSEAVSFLHF